MRERVLGRARGEAGLRGELGRAGLSFGFGLGWVCFPIYLGFLFSIPNSNKLNPNESKFEFEFTQALKQIKPMLQHDASTKFKLMIKF